MDGTKFTLEPFKRLNDAYADKPSVGAANLQNHAVRGVQRSETLERVLGLQNKSVLEVGCGAGRLAHQALIQQAFAR